MKAQAQTDCCPRRRRDRPVRRLPTERRLIPFQKCTDDFLLRAILHMENGQIE